MASSSNSIPHFLRVVRALAKVGTVAIPATVMATSACGPTVTGGEGGKGGEGTSTTAPPPGVTTYSGWTTGTTTTSSYSGWTTGTWTGTTTYSGWETGTTTGWGGGTTTSENEGGQGGAGGGGAGGDDPGP